MPQGTVKWFDNQKGYGFISTESNQDEIFAHYSSIDMNGYKSLKPGQQVSFEINQGPKGLFAKNIIALRPPKKNNNNKNFKSKNFNSNKGNNSQPKYRSDEPFPSTPNASSY